VDDKILTLVSGVLNDKEEELGYQKLLNLDRAEDHQYVVDRMRLQMYHAQMAEDQATMSMNSPQWREEVNQLQKSTHARKERFTQLYRQGVRKPEKFRTAGNGVEGAGKEDDALKLKRQPLTAQKDTWTGVSQNGRTRKRSRMAHRSGART
jgi:hypothetical protein